jgi:hypothetical protein
MSEGMFKPNPDGVAGSQAESVEAVALIVPEDQEPALTTGRLILKNQRLR